MDIAALSTSMASSQLQQAVGIQMLSNTMDVSESQGKEIVSMIDSVPKQQMELSVNPHIGSMFDMSV